MDIADVHPGNIGSHEQFQVFHAILDYKVIFYMSWLVSACEIVIYITGCRGVCATTTWLIRPLFCLALLHFVRDSQR